MSDDEVIDEMEIDLEVAHIGELLARHGAEPSIDLVLAIWDWAESLRQVAEGSVD